MANQGGEGARREGRVRSGWMEASAGQGPEGVAAVRDRLAELRQLSCDEISALPTATQFDVDVDGARRRLIVWHERSKTSEEWVIVQLYTRGFLGVFRRLHGEGFAVDREGRQRALTAQEVNEFTW